MASAKRKNEDISSDVSKLRDLVTVAFENYKQGKKQDSLQNLQQVTLEIIALKQDNRDFQNNAEQLKTTVTQEKIKLDQLNLQLQNLLYEKNHLKKEIVECRDFKRSQQEPHLVSEEEFFQLAPPELTKPENDHQKMINRLTFELQQRKSLCVKVEELKSRKKALSEVSTNKSKFLDSLPSRISALSKTTSNIQQQLSIQLPNDSKFNNYSNYLPLPLYTIYYQAAIYKETEDSTLSVSISGSLDDAISFNHNQLTQEQLKSKLSTLNDEDKKKLLYSTFPLTVNIELSSEDSKKTLTIKFEYFVHLNIVGVLGSGLSSSFDKLVLVNLFPNDSGETSPNPFNSQLAANNKFQYDDLETLQTRPFKWAQHLGGLNFLEDPSKVGSSWNKEKSMLSFSKIIKQIKSRISSVVQLQTQLDSNLTKLQYPEIVNSLAFPRKSTTYLSSWSEIVKKKGSDDTELLAFYKEDNSLLWQKLNYYRYFKATLKKDNVQLQALIEVSPEYPVRAPLFRLQHLNKDSASVSYPASVKEKSDPSALQVASQNPSNYDSNLKLIEIELNAQYYQLTPDELPNDYLLAYQVKKLDMCFDIYVNTLQNSDEFKKGLERIRPVTGKIRHPLF